MRRLALLVLFAGLLPALDLTEVKAEPNLEKRSEKALIYADTVLTSMRKQLDTGDMAQIKAELADFTAAVDLSMESLDATGKNARKNPKYFKRAEHRMRDLRRRLITFQRDLSFEDRPALDDARAHLVKQIDKLVEATLRGS